MSVQFFTPRGPKNEMIRLSAAQRKTEATAEAASEAWVAAEHTAPSRLQTQRGCPHTRGTTTTPDTTSPHTRPQAR